MVYRRLTAGAVRMPDYRVYCLDGTGRIELAEWIEAADDEEAVRKAHDMNLHALKCEIWHEERLVAVLDAGDLSGE
jgi:hypothetical protein